MGTKLKDDIPQGAASGDEFRTALLWVSDSVFSFCTTDTPRIYCGRSAIIAVTGSEANGVIANFNLLSPTQQQDLLNFLRSL
jgi:hypothetical protein